MNAGAELAETAWWTRVERAAKHRGPAGSKAMSDWTHDVLSVLCAAEMSLELVDGGWHPIPPNRCTDEYKQAETRRLNDQLGRRLGVGPMP